MPQKRIFTVGFELPGEEFEYVQFGSNQTLLDADIILFEPTLGRPQIEFDHRRGGSALFEGLPILDQHSSFEAKKQVDHWRSEIDAALSAGRLIIVYLAAPIEYYRYTGEKRYSGTGKSREVTPIVARISSYDSIPKLSGATPKSGTSITLGKDGAFLAPYWREFGGYSPYQVEIEGDFGKVLLTSAAGARIVGAAVHAREGVLLFLPPLRFDDHEFIKELEEVEEEGQDDDNYWTEDALRFGKRLVSTLVLLADSLKAASKSTPPPDWSVRSEYRLAEESVLEAAILRCAAEAASLLAEKERLESQLVDVGGLRRLLFEQGKPLEIAVLDAMRLLGFDAKSFADGESEFDGVFVCPEGRCLGEAEGKDNRAVNIDKFGQLERNLQEDFARDEVAEYAKGILFGNAYRLVPIGERSEFFTAKCLSAAKRVGAALVRTPDLFVPARYLRENPSDADYARRCRLAILGASGAIVSFPPPPVGATASAVEVTEAES